MRRFAIGDIHGGYLGLKQVLNLSGFDIDKDELICLGDVCDGWSQTYEVVETLMNIKNLTLIKGNHDEWMERFLMYSHKGIYPHDPHHMMWITQGGRSTVDSYLHKSVDDVKRHLKFISSAKLYHIDSEGNLFVHAGIDPRNDIDDQPFMDYNGKENSFYYWDRKLWRELCNQSISNTLRVKKVKPYNEIYIGHTPTTRKFEHGEPVNIANVWNLDTGAAFNGRLTIMDIDTKEFWQSDPLTQLYPKERGRN